MRARLLLVGLVAFGVSLLAIDARSTYGARVSSDEPQYLLTAMSLWEDFDLDVSDEIAERRYEPFHEITINQQTIALNDSGQELSPHDPLLPLVLMVPYGIAGWVGAKVMLSIILGLTAALTLHVAVSRFGASVGPATWIIGAFFTAPPLTSYGTHIFPAGTAALALMTAFWAVTHPSRSRRWDVVAVLAIVALPWLSVKYVPHAAVVTLGLAWKHRAARDRLVALGGVFAVAGATYLLLHQGIYGGWTVYSTGDHFIEGSEFDVVGRRPRLLQRSRRLVGLIIDTQFGIGAWTPSFLAMPAALAALGRVRRDMPSVLAAGVILAGWAVATWVALTMHGWWWPGRQITPVLPFVVIAIALWVGDRPRHLLGVAGATLLGTATWLILAWEASTDRRALIVDFYDVESPWYQALASTLPDHQRLNDWDSVMTFVWMAILGASVVIAWRGARRPPLEPAPADDDQPSSITVS
ncbi:MAG: hypothetical protein AAF081_09040 [Actinomycetota bacterium]